MLLRLAGVQLPSVERGRVVSDPAGGPESGGFGGFAFCHV